jgi:hypothetical protein
METEVYMELENEFGDLMLVYRGEPNVVPLSDEWTRTLCRYFTWHPNYDSIQPHSYPNPSDFIDSLTKQGLTTKIKSEVSTLHELIDEVVSRLYKDGNVYAVPLFVSPTTSLDYSPTLEFTTIYSSDRNFVGFAFATREEIYRWFKTKRITKSIENEILTMVNRELVIYNEYMKGATYHYVIKNVDGVEIDRGIDFYELDGDTDKMLELMINDSSVYDTSFVEI